MVNSALKEVRKVGDESVTAGRGPGQLGWYEFACRFVAGKTVLDAGCGLGKGLDILKRHCAYAQGQDLDERLHRSDVWIGELDDLPAKSVDVVVSIDVVEHVEDDASFIQKLARIARESIFITTPNWTASRCSWPYHLREYTPGELEQLLEPVGKVQLFKGNSSGTEVHLVRHASLYKLLNDLRIWTPTAFATRCLNRIVLPRTWQLHGHNAALVTNLIG